MASIAAIVSSVADLFLQRAAIYRMITPMLPSDTGDTKREYTLLYTDIPCQIFWSGGKQFGSSPIQDFGYRVIVSPVAGIFLLEADILERDRIIVDDSPYTVLFVRIEYDNVVASHKLVALERAAVKPFLDGDVV